MVTLTPTSNLDPTDPNAFLEAQQAHIDAFNALYEATARLSDYKLSAADTKRNLAIREAELIAAGLDGKNATERDADLELKKATDEIYRDLRVELVITERDIARVSAEVDHITAEVSNAKLRMQFLIAWNQAEAQRREAL